MPALAKCVECGGDVSSAATECPHCHRNPRPVTCAFCRLPLKQSQAIEMMHPACYESHHAAQSLEKFSCPVCLGEFSYRDFKFALVQSMDLTRPASTSPCPKCGNPFDVEKCDHCGGGMIKGTGEMVNRVSQLPLQVHKFCVRFVQNKAQSSASKASCMVVVIAVLALPLPVIYLLRALI